MELVLLQDVQGGYGSQYIRIANTAGVEDIHIGDCFREQGFGKGAEELKVDGIDISRVGGASKLFVIRGANATQPEVHRLGCVFEMVSIAVEEPMATSAREVFENIADTVTNSIRAQAAGIVALDDPLPAARSTNAERQKRFRERKKAATSA